jgi:hypothetical protein
MVVAAAALLIASCGDDSSSGGAGAIDNEVGASRSSGSNIDVCDLLSAEDLSAALGEARQPEESEPAGPFTGCSWGTGDIIVSVAETGSIILAPGEDECPSAGLGEESYACEGRVKFLTDGIHVTVSTIDPFVTDDQLQGLAERILSKLAN